MKLNIKKISTQFLLDVDKNEIDLILDKLVPKNKNYNRILLISPPDGDKNQFNIKTALSGRYPNFPPYGLGIIANHLKKRKFEVEILNLNNHLLEKAHSLKESLVYEEVINNYLVEYIDNYKPDLIGITCMFTMTHYSLKNVINTINKNFNIPIAIGGVHITNSLASESTREKFIIDLINADFFFTFESELAFVDFLNIINQKNRNYKILKQIYILSKDKKLVISVDDRVVTLGNDLDLAPAHELMPAVNFKKYGKIGDFGHLKKEGSIFSSILSNRGCRASCTFCSVRNFNGKKVRSRAVQSVVDELLYLRHEQNVSHVMFLDDDLLYDRERAIDLFTQMEKQKVGITWDASNGLIASAIKEDVAEAMYKSGCIGVYLGMESGNPQILRQIRKPGTVENFITAANILKKYPNISTRVLLMIGFPNETFENILDTIKVSLEMDLDWYQVSPLQPLPNTPIFDQMFSLASVAEENFDTVRYIGGSYGDIRRDALNKKNVLLDSFLDIFKDKDKNQVPSKGEIKIIWAYMNYKLNFERLHHINNPIKLEQAYKYLGYVAEVVAPNDAVAWYYYMFLANKISSEKKENINQYFHNLLKSNSLWKKQLASLNLSF